MKTNIKNRKSGALLVLLQLIALGLIGFGGEWLLKGLGIAVVGALIWIDLNVKGRAK